MKFALMTGLAFTVCLVTSHAQTFSPKNLEYVLQSGDVLEIHYRYTPEFDQTVTIRPDHRATLLNLEPVDTKGMTVAEFQKAVLQLSGKLLVDPQITVVLKEFEKSHVYVEGEVTTPGKVEFRSEITVMDAIAMAGGFKSSGAKNKVYLVRRTDDGQSVKTSVLDLQKLIDEKNVGEAIHLQSNDVIYVTQNTFSKIERISHLGTFGAVYNPIF